MGVYEARGPIVFTQDLDGSTATTAFPVNATYGVAGFPVASASGSKAGSRVHVRLRYQVAAGTMSTDVHLYGLVDPTTSAWSYLGSLNEGTSIAADAKWNKDAATIAVCERFEIGAGQFSRYATRCINPQGTTQLVSTWIGYERE